MQKKTKKKFKKKSFFFEDYTEFEINFDQIKSETIKISPNRITILSFIFFSLILIFCFKITYLSTIPEVYKFTEKVEHIFQKSRADIVDRNGVILARNTNIYTAGIRPKFIKDKEKFLLNFRLKFPEIDEKNLMKKLHEGKFFYLENKRLTEEQKDRLWSLGLSNKVLELKKIQHRIYPQKKLFSHILGQINDNNSGISGVEKFFDNDLTNENLIENSLELTLDSSLQHIIREELINSQIHFNQVGSAALLMDVNNGHILSLVSLPDYDLNKRSSINEHAYTNKITKGVYELGSVFKTFTIAAGFENKIIKPDTIFKNLESQVYCAGTKISEHDKLPKNLSAEQILIRSSNIGSIKVAQNIGIEKYRKFLNSLELFQTIDFDLEEIGKPLSFKWGKCKLATAAFGHGITTTPLQLTKAYAILSNGGYKIEPTIVLNNKKNFMTKKRIVSSETSKEINKILRKVVFNKEGTANFADIKGYEVGGKTGTALKSENGIYTSKKLNTFISIFPSSKPKYILLVILDEPKPAPHYVYEFPNGYKHKGELRNTSGWNTVVVAGKIIEKIGPILAINNLQASKNF